MTLSIAAGFMSDEVDRTDGDMETAFEEIVSLLKETLGGTSEINSTAMRIVSGVVAIQDNASAYQIDTTGGTAATDTLNRLTVLGTTRDGYMISIRGTNTGRVVTVANAATGAGQIFTCNGLPFILRDPRSFMILRYSSSSTGWIEVMRSESSRIDQMLGGVNATTLVNTGTAGTITPTTAVHDVDTSGASTETVGNALCTTLADVGRVITLAALNSPTRIPTLMHMHGGAGQFQMADSASFAFSDPSVAIMFQLRLVTAVLTWVEIFRYKETVPTPTTKGQSPICSTAGVWSLLTLPASSQGYVEVIDTSANGTNSVRFQQGPPAAPQGRLTTITAGSNTFVPNSSPSATLWWQPFGGSVVWIWDLTSLCYVPYSNYTPPTLSLSGLTNNTVYYFYLTGVVSTGVISVNATTTAPVVLNNGFLGFSGHPEWLYVGVGFVQSGAITQYPGTGTSSLYLRNHYNRLPITLGLAPPATSWTYASTTVRAWDATTTSLNVVSHNATFPDKVDLTLLAQWKTTLGTANPTFAIGINDNTALLTPPAPSTTSVFIGATSSYSTVPNGSATILNTTHYSSIVRLQAGLFMNYTQGMGTLAPMAFWPLELIAAGGTLTQYGSDSATGQSSGLFCETTF